MLNGDAAIRNDLNDYVNGIRERNEIEPGSAKAKNLTRLLLVLETTDIGEFESSNIVCKNRLVFIRDNGLEKMMLDIPWIDVDRLWSVSSDCTALNMALVRSIDTGLRTKVWFLMNVLGSMSDERFFDVLRKENLSDIDYDRMANDYLNYGKNQPPLVWIVDWLQERDDHDYR